MKITVVGTRINVHCIDLIFRADSFRIQLPIRAKEDLNYRTGREEIHVKQLLHSFTRCGDKFSYKLGYIILKYPMTTITYAKSTENTNNFVSHRAVRTASTGNFTFSTIC